MKRIINLGLMVLVILAFAVGCGTESDQGNGGNNTPPNNNDSSFDTSETINLVSREDGSGTRGAFVEIVNILVDDNDAIYEEAVIQNSTNGVMTTVAGDQYGIGYISLGSLNDTVTSVKVDDVEATADNVKSGDYKIARPFNIAYQENLSELGQDFINFILSEVGQKVVEDSGLVSVDNGVGYNASGLSGTIVVGGSTSVTPVMEKLKEAYEALNNGVTVQIQSTGSSAGMTAAIEGSADIGMASRELKDSEKAELTYEAIAIDGIAVIVNNSNPINNLTMDQIQGIYLGNITNWSEVE